MKFFRLKKHKSSGHFQLVKKLSSSIDLKLIRKKVDGVARISDKFLISFFSYFFSMLEKPEDSRFLEKKKNKLEKIKIFNGEITASSFHPLGMIPFLYKQKQEILKYFMGEGKLNGKSRNFSMKNFRGFLFQYHGIKFIWSKKIKFPSDNV